MQFSFQYTSEEYVKHRQLNNFVGGSPWQGYAWTILCVLPSFGLICLTQSLIGIVSCIAIIIVLIVMGLIAAINEKGPSDYHQHHVKITSTSNYRSHSHSESEVCWDAYDEFLEDETFLMLRHASRFTTIPKRALSEEQHSRLRVIGEQLNARKDDDSKAEISNELFQRLFKQGGEEPIYTFRYEREDLLNAGSERLTPVAPETQAKPPIQTLFGKIFWPLVAMVMIGVVLNSIAPENDPWTPLGILLVMAALVAPYFCIKFLNKLLSRKRSKSISEVPRDMNMTRLLKNGWAIGNEKSCQIFDWRDVTRFYQNQHCFGIRTINNLMQILPKKIFADEVEAEKFISEASVYRDEYLRSFEGVAIQAIETGNPYQPPMAQ